MARIALMHGALDSLPKGLIPGNLASQKDLDLVICGDQHGPSDGDDDTSELFNLETSRKRKLPRYGTRSTAHQSKFHRLLSKP